MSATAMGARASSKARSSSSSSSSSVTNAPTNLTPRRYAVVDLPTAAGSAPWGPSPLFEGGCYTLSRDAVERATAADGRTVRFDRVLLARDGGRRPSASSSSAASGLGRRARYVRGAWVEAEIVEHLSPSPVFGGALSRVFVKRIVVGDEEEEPEAEGGGGAAAATSSR
jgi:hypothetical protein